MPILTDQATARARLIQMTAATSDPALDTSGGATDDINLLLAEFKRASVWVANTAYKVNDVVIPTDSNRTGRRYVCVVKGTSGATEPTWPDGRDDQVSDGSTLVWREAGLEVDLWDMNGAAQKGWELKAGKAAAYADVGSGDDRKSKNQIYEHCKKQAASFASVMVA